MKFEEIQLGIDNMFNMKSLVVFCSFVCVGLCMDAEFSMKMTEKIVRTGAECAKEVHASGDDIDEIMNEKIPSSRAGKCLISCVHKRFGIQGPDGGFDLPGALAAIGPIKDNDADLYGKLRTVMETCGQEVPNNPDECIFGANLMECGHRVGRGVGLTKDSFNL